MTLSRRDVGFWLISMERDSQRRMRLQAQLAQFGLRATWFKAIDGRACAKELETRVDRAAYQRNMGQTLLAGKMGVYASHAAVWQEFLQSPYKAALILEDDTVLHDDFPQALDTALMGAEFWDLLRFNCVRAKMPVTQGRMGGYDLNAYFGPFTGNACYLIQRAPAQRILPRLFPQTRALDHELNRFFLHDYRQFGLQPWASHTDDGGVSTITGAKFADVNKLHWTRRLPHYGIKLANYVRRFAWLLRRRMLGRSARVLVPLSSPANTGAP